MTPVASVSLKHGKVSRAISDYEAMLGAPALRLNGFIPHPSPVLRRQSLPGMGPGDLYAHMFATDADLRGFAERRANTTFGLGREVTAQRGGPRPAQNRRAAELFEWLVGCNLAPETRPPKIHNLYPALKRALIDMRWKGVGFLELRWGQVQTGLWKGWLVPVSAHDRPMKRFRFGTDPNTGDWRLHLAKGRTPETSPVVGEGQVIVLRSGSADTPWGEGLLDAVYWEWVTKLEACRMWSKFLETFAADTIIVDYEHEDGDDTRRVNEA